MRDRVITGDCLTVMPTLDADSIDAIVTDPPYGLGFMGKEWDHGVPGVEFWTAAKRVAKPGAHLVAFGGTRTYHRLACAIEDAGWEIRDCLSWLYGSGFPKSHNGPWGGTALKPAWEPVILARKPLRGTVEGNTREFGAGALNIDACRIAGDNPSVARRSGAINHLSTRPAAETEAEGRLASRQSPDAYRAERPGELLGRWPANVALDEEAARLLDETTGELTSGANPTRRGGPKFRTAYGEFEGQAECVAHRGTDTGGASRFFYTSKAGRAERNAGLDGAEKPLNWSNGEKNPGSFQSPNTKRAALNHHPTVKPLDLMQWLCRLVTPKGGLILDPFTGSGSTGRAAVAEGFRFLGIELNEEYAAIARARIAEYAPLFADVTAEGA